MATYTELASGGTFSSADHRMFIRLYPYSSSEASAVSSSNDTIPTGLEDACKQLLNHGAIDYYEIDKFEPCSEGDGTKRYPVEADVSSMYDFRQFLKDNDAYSNGCNEDLTYYQGSHLMVWDKDECSTSTANASGYTGCGSTAFTTGLGAFTPTTGCSDAKIKASAIQEALHNFINWEDQDVRCKVDCNLTSKDTNYEHALGEVDSDNNVVTPLLTYHVSEVGNVGLCSENGRNYGHTTTLTPCTKDAVQITANDPNCTADQ